MTSCWVNALERCVIHALSPSVSVPRERARESRTLRFIAPALLFLGLVAATAFAQAPIGGAAPRSASDPLAADTKGDEGGSIMLRWTLSPDDSAGQVTGYEIFRATKPDGPFNSVGFASRGSARFADGSTDDDSAYYYKIITTGPGGSTETAVIGPARSTAEWFNSNRANVLVIGLLISGAVLYYIASARKGKKLFIRRIAGLEAVHDAIGRATEMGRPILYIPGIQDMDDVQTVAGVTILGYVARTIAEYDTKLEVPTSRSIVMSTARETIKAAFLAAGRPEKYSDDMVNYITDEQFGYVAAVDGIMVREKPATCFYMGAFFAEALIMAETGNSIGAIQIAGTAMPAQLPFFVAACDYTLIGEELFAASAYLSNEPRQLGSLKGQDVGKTIAMLAIGAGTALFTLNQVFRVEWFASAGQWLKNLFIVN